MNNTRRYCVVKLPLEQLNKDRDKDKDKDKDKDL
ncbi:MAG: hypothetical protein ACI9FJ_002409 [Alteromonadaceae bacterium]|jgi:hypothetical protein